MRVKIKGMSRLDHQSYVGPEGSLVILEETKALRVHDGVTPGGHPASGIPDVDPHNSSIVALRNGEWVAIEAEEIPIENGPGPQELQAGDLHIGYYGQVTDAELFTGDELAAAIGLSEGTSVGDEIGWFKFAYKGKVLYIPKRPLRTGVRWQTLYALGCVYGTNNGGPIDLDFTVNQLTMVEKNGVTYIVRLPRGLNVSTPSSNITGDDPPITHGSEWNDLMYRVSSTVPNSQVERNWEEFSDDELGFTLGATNDGSLCQERRLDNTNYVFLRGYTKVSNTSGGFLISTGYHWRPVLEVINPDSLLLQPVNIGVETSFIGAAGGIDYEIHSPVPVRTVTYSTAGLLAPSGVDYEVTE